MSIEKIRYLASSLRKTIFRQDLTCPSCGGKESLVVSRKYLVTSLRRCQNCKLLFRSPTTQASEQKSFYQQRYSQGFTTELPGTYDLERLKKEGFRGGEKDYSGYLAVLDALGRGKGDKVFDYGCSWGYGSWQMAQAGYRVSAFEISEHRREYARRHLEVEVLPNMDACAKKSFDVFFSAHVIEHVPSVFKMIQLAQSIVKRGGWIVIFSPNGCDEFRVKEPGNWNLAWGLVHPNFLDEKFYSKAFEQTPHLMASSPYDLAGIKNWSGRPQSSAVLNLEGPELLVVAKEIPFGGEG